MENFVRIYTEGIIDRLTIEGVEVVTNSDEVTTSEDGMIAIYKMDTSGMSNLADSEFVFFNRFCEKYYPSEFSVPKSNVVQIVLRNVYSKSLKGFTCNVGVQFSTEDPVKPVLLVRLFDPRYYDADGSYITGPSFAAILENLPAEESARILPEVDEE